MVAERILNNESIPDDYDDRSHKVRNAFIFVYLALLLSVTIGAINFFADTKISDADGTIKWMADTENMVLVEGGTMTIGLTPEQGEAAFDELPAHDVSVKDFYIFPYEVSVEQWNAVMGLDVEWDSAPVRDVSWDDCQRFIARLDSITGKHFRLPTEDEWEYAARGGKFSHGYKYAGSNDFHAVVIPNESGSPYPVCGGSPNELKLYEMSSGVSEWVTGTSGNPDSICVARGGSSYYGPELCRVSSRNVYPHDYTDRYLGFRLAMDAE